MMVLLFGLLLGARHALEPDHVAAVSTLLARGARGQRRSTVLLGACWGIGHAMALLAVGCTLGALHANLPAAVSELFEILVAIMLVILGVRAVLGARKLGSEGPLTLHRHGSAAHSHTSTSSHVHLGSWAVAWRPLLVGAVHGLAGSGALTALAMTDLPTVGARLGYIALFGLGSAGGMALLMSFAGWQLERLGRTIERPLTIATGLLSTGLGVWWGCAALLSLARM